MAHTPRLPDIGERPDVLEKGDIKHHTPTPVCYNVSLHVVHLELQEFEGPLVKKIYHNGLANDIPLMDKCNVKK